MILAPSPFAPARFPDLPQVHGVRAATASRGFYAPRGLDREDVFLMVFDPGTRCAGVFTRSATASADVLWCREALAASGGSARALLVNSGNSNAFTGTSGRLKNDASLASLTAALGVDRTDCYLAATGVIGEPLADPNFVGAKVPELASRLGPPDWEALARAFMTTDTYPKGAGAQIEIDGHAVALAGIAKGSGMIAPNMATMLAYIVTDAAIAPALLGDLVRAVTDQTFNAINVDGDTSTSDTFMVFATGAAGHAPIDDPGDPRLAAFRDALLAVARDLAFAVVRDGEGATKFITIHVEGAASPADARAVAASIANSPLVKTALAAGDANWGRVVMAAGKAGVAFDQSALAIWFGAHAVAEAGGRAPGYDEATASAICAAPEITLRVSLGTGPGTATVHTCDLTHAYIDINGAYRT